MQKLPDFVPTFSHHLKPLTSDGSQFTCMVFHPRIDGGIQLDSAVESQQFRSHRRSISVFEICGYLALLPFLQQNPSSLRSEPLVESRVCQLQVKRACDLSRLLHFFNSSG